MNGLLTVTVEKTDPEGVVVYILEGELDLHEAAGFKQKLIADIKEGATKVLLDLTNLKYIDSSGIGAMIGGLQTAVKSGGKLKICGMNDSIRKPFELANLIKFFEIFPDRASALRSFT